MERGEELRDGDACRTQLHGGYLDAGMKASATFKNEARDPLRADGE